MSVVTQRMPAKAKSVRARLNTWDHPVLPGPWRVAAQGCHLAHMTSPYHKTWWLRRLYRHHAFHIVAPPSLPSLSLLSQQIWPVKVWFRMFGRGWYETCAQ